MDALCAFQLTEALKGAIELDVFTHIAALKGEGVL